MFSYIIIAVSDCLNINDDAVVENIGKYISISDLDSNQNFFLEQGQNNFIEDRIALSNVLSQINSILEIYHQFPEKHKKSEYIQLRKLILVWLKDCGAQPEVDD